MKKMLLCLDTLGEKKFIEYIKQKKSKMQELIKMVIKKKNYIKE